MTQVPDGEKHVDKRPEGVKFNGAVEPTDFKAELLPENIDPTVVRAPALPGPVNVGSLSCVRSLHCLWAPYKDRWAA